MKRPLLKVYFYSYITQKPLKGCVATTSKKEAARLFGVSYYKFNSYGGEIFDEKSHKVALNKPGQVFVCEINDRYRDTCQYVESHGVN